MGHGEGHGELREGAAHACRELDELFDGVELGGVFGDRGIEERRAERGTAGCQVDGLVLAVLAGEESEGEGAPDQYPMP
ncbi:hypothetical protein SVIO_066000 [Streptomyces violaceusniger]|uniref:Uncharacterized protein n=1 Tax=Streptomyces violaceusniger TaxID=68280 RepID=A0A4D4LBN3_STRVO|nr:hypothetical protein SVIO_066000 [Streptomyces violaceusniger]